MDPARAIELATQRTTGDQRARPRTGVVVVERPMATRLSQAKRQRPHLVGAPQGAGDAAPTAPGGSGSFFRACILLLLRERSGHGYDLLERLAEFGFDSGDSGWLYRTLRSFEREHIVESTWEISASGPPRRVYSLTENGGALLEAWSVSIREGRRAIETFLGRYRSVGAWRPPG